MQELVALKDFKFGGIMIRRDMVIHMNAENARFYTAVGAVGPRDADGSGKLLPRKVATAPVAPVAPPPAAPTATAPKRKATKKRATKKAK
jgi:hypothetical protein